MKNALPSVELYSGFFIDNFYEFLSIFFVFAFGTSASKLQCRLEIIARHTHRFCTLLFGCQYEIGHRLCYALVVSTICHFKHYSLHPSHFVARYESIRKQFYLVQFQQRFKERDGEKRMDRETKLIAPTFNKDGNSF